MSKAYGYARVSTREQNEDRQVLALLSVEVEEKNIFSSVQFPQNYLAPAGEGLNPEWME